MKMVRMAGHMVAYFQTFPRVKKRMQNMFDIDHKVLRRLLLPNNCSCLRARHCRRCQCSNTDSLDLHGMSQIFVRVHWKDRGVQITKF